METATEKQTVESLQAGDYISGLFLAQDIQVKSDRRGNQRTTMVIRDGTGTVDAILWGVIPGLGDGPVQVDGDVGTFNGALQVNVSNLVPVPGADMVGLLPTTPRDIDAMMSSLWGAVARIENEHLKLTISDVIANKTEKLQQCPAGKSMHHACIGGLLEHTTSLLAMAWRAAQHYGLSAIERDALLAGCILHDIGKTVELSWSNGFAYTTPGKLIGHVGYGLMIAKAALDEHGVSEELALRVLHVIASHHGQREYGALQPPLTREAIIFHSLDLMDAKLNSLAQKEAESVDADGFTGFVRALDGCAFVGVREAA